MDSVEKQGGIADKAEGEQEKQFVIGKELLYGGQGKNNAMNNDICTKDVTREEMEGLSPSMLEGSEAAVRGDDKKQLRKENK